MPSDFSTDLCGPPTWKDHLDFGCHPVCMYVDMYGCQLLINQKGKPLLL